MNMKLVVYFSYTNHTRYIANKISKELNCDILELKPTIPYSSDYQAVVDDENNSQSSTFFPEIENINIDLSKYNEIIIGFPTWWYRPAGVMRTFLKNNDFTNKTVIPFATNAGWLGDSFTEVKALCKGAVVKNEMNIVFATNHNETKLVTSESDIDRWINSLKEDI